MLKTSQNRRDTQTPRSFFCVVFFLSSSFSRHHHALLSSSLLPSYHLSVLCLHLLLLFLWCFLHLLFSSLSSLSSFCVFCLCCLLSPDLYLFFCSLLSSSKPSLSLFPLHCHLLRLFLTSLLSYRRLLLLVSAVFFIFVCSFCLFTAVVF